MDSFDALLSWMERENGQVAIFDAANATIMRRAKLTEKIAKLNANRTGEYDGIRAVPRTWLRDPAPAPSAAEANLLLLTAPYSASRQASTRASSPNPHLSTPLLSFPFS